MGGAQSLFAENDWDAADGTLDSNEQTIDGAAPTTSYQTYFLVKKAVLANQREFDVTDSKSNLLFHVRPSLGTIAGFDVLGVGSATTDDYMLRVTVDIARRHWIVYRFDKPVFEGQKHDEAATMKFAMEQLTDRKELAARISASLTIHSFHDDDSATPIQPPVPKHFLYKVCCVTVSWSRYMAVAALYGPPTLEQLLHSKKRNEAVQELDEDDVGGDLLLQASRIAQSRRSLADDLEDDSESGPDTLPSISPPMVDPSAATEIPSAATDIAPETIPEDESESDIDTMPIASPPTEQDGATTDTPAIDTTPDTPDGPEKHETPSDETEQTSLTSTVDDDKLHEVLEADPTLEMDHEQATAGAIVDATSSTTVEATTDAVSAVTSVLVNDGVEVIVSNGTAENVDPLVGVDMGADEAVDTDDKSNESKAASASQESLSKPIDASNDEGDNDIEIKSSHSMPERTYDAYASHQADKLRTWFNETSRTIHTKSKSIMRARSHSFDDSDSVATGNNYAAFLGLKSSEEDDPLEGVMHLEKPLLLCQEIYTRIIGNHQTSRVSKDKVLKLLKQDMEHLDDNSSNPDKDDSSNGSPISSKKGLSPMQKKDSEKSLEAELPSKSVKETAEAPASEVETDADDVSSPPKDKEQPLVGYWAWEHSLRTHKIKMHLAKGSDLALHVVLAVLVNQVRYERNAIAIAV